MTNKVYFILSYINAKILWSCITILLCCPIFSPKAGTGTIREMPDLRTQRSRARLAPGEDVCEKCRCSNSSDYLSSNEHPLVGRGVCCRYHASLPSCTPPLQGRTSWRRRIESQNQTLCFRRWALHIFALGENKLVMFSDGTWSIHLCLCGFCWQGHLTWQNWIKIGLPWGINSVLSVQHTNGRSHFALINCMHLFS